MNNIAVTEIKTRINNYLLNSPDSEKNSRETMIQFLEEILMNTDNYHGFQYLSKFDMNKSNSGISVGINLIESTDFDKQFINTDQSRVKYL